MDQQVTLSAFIQINKSTFFDNDIIHYIPFEMNNSLPFPLYLPAFARVMISACLAIALVLGTNYRMMIFKYLQAPETKIGPINYLIWIDQLNGIFLGVSMAIKIILIIIPVPLNEVVGNSFCNWIDLPGDKAMILSNL